jgi:cytochrome c551/c552
MTKTVLLALSLSAFVLACGPATPESTLPIGVSAPPTTPPGEVPAAPAPVTPPATPAPAASAPAAGASNVWRADFTMDQQIAFMKTNVVPHMGPVFQAANAKRYADFGCKTCHGPNGKPPPEFLPHLTLQGGKMTCFVQNPDVSKFMASRVVPEMAASLGMPAYDPATKQGFGCAGCHVVDVK